MEGNRAVLYLRLSKEDVDKINKGDDSSSIKSQRLLLTDYALEHDFKIVKVYSDDDESGLYDTRPNFEQMMNDAKLGKFDIIIAKTQSRFSRNMEHIEKYLHHYLPNLGIRFIGVIDGVDTENAENKKSRQINGLVNEWYCEDLSKNIRSAFKAKMKDGQYLGATCPYGYVKDPDNHNHLIIDEYAANIVRKIYRLYLQGLGKNKIAATLTSEGVLIPSIYKKEILKINYHNPFSLETTKHWSYQTIHTILNNEVYTGTLVQNKMNNLSYKDKRKIHVPRDKWVIVEDCHEPIISKETFDDVKRLQKTRTKTVKTGNKDGVFSGLLFCADCGHSLLRKYARHGGGFIGYCCKTYKTLGKNFCTSHSIKNDELEEIVLQSIRSEAKSILNEEDIGELKKIRAYNHAKDFYESQLESIQKRMEKVQQFKEQTYENLMDDLISRDEYKKYVSKYDKELLELKHQQKTIKDKSNLEKELETQHDMWVDSFINYINIDKLTKDIVFELIEKIVVHDNNSIDIYYRFKNPYK